MYTVALKLKWHRNLVGNVCMLS